MIKRLFGKLFGLTRADVSAEQVSRNCSGDLLLGRSHLTGIFCHMFWITSSSALEIS
jgi:hypothetical protein